MPIKKEPPKSKKIVIDDIEYTPFQLKREYIKLKKELEEKESTIECICCGESKSEDKFHSAKNNMYSKKITPVCKKCLEKIARGYDVDGNTHPPTRDTLIKALLYMNKPFYKSVYEKAVAEADRLANNRDFASIYFKKISSSLNYANKTFLDSDFFSTKENVIFDISEFDNDTLTQLYKDRHDTIEICKKDPFINADDADKPFLYNTLVGILGDVDEEQDTVKINAAISVTKDYLALEKLDKKLADQLNPKNGQIDSEEVERDIRNKKNLINEINQHCKESQLSVSSKGTSKGRDTFTGRMRQMKDMNFRDAQVNGFDLETCYGMEQVLDISHKSIMKQLRLDDSDYAKMVADQREIIKNLRKDKNFYEEISRIVIGENLDLKKLLDENDVEYSADSKSLYELIVAHEQEKSDPDE